MQANSISLFRSNGNVHRRWLRQFAFLRKRNRKNASRKNFEVSQIPPRDSFIPFDWRNDEGGLEMTSFRFGIISRTHLCRATRRLVHSRFSTNEIRGFSRLSSIISPIENSDSKSSDRFATTHESMMHSI